MGKRLLSDVLSGFLAGASGGLAGEQAAQERQRVLGLQQRQMQNEDQDRALRAYLQGAQLERQENEDAMLPAKFWLQNSDPEAPGYAEGLDKAMGMLQPRQGRFPSTGLPGLPGMGAGMAAPPSAGASTVFSAQGKPQYSMGQPPAGLRPNTLGAMGSPPAGLNIRSDGAMGKVPAGIGGLPPIARLDPKLEKKRAAFLQGAESNRKSLETIDLPKSQAIGKIIAQVSARELTPEQGDALLTPILAETQTRFQQEKDARLKREEDAALRDERDFKLREDIFKQNAESERLAKEAAAKKEKAAQLLKIDDDLSAELNAARKSGNFNTILKAGTKRAKFRAANRDVFGDIDDLYSPEAREIVEMGPIAQGYKSKTTVGPEGIRTQGVPGEAELGPLRRRETDAEVRLRIAKQAEEDAESSEEALGAAKEAMSNVWKLITDPHASEQTRTDAWNTFEGYKQKYPHLRGLYPAKKPNMTAMTPAEQQRMDLEWLKFEQSRVEDQRQAASHEATMKLRALEFEKIVDEIKATRKKPQAITPYDQNRLDDARKDVEAIRKTLGELRTRSPENYPTKNQDIDTLLKEFEAANKVYKARVEQVLGPTSLDPGKRAANDAIAIAEKKWKMAHGANAVLPEAMRNKISQAARAKAGYGLSQ